MTESDEILFDVQNGLGLITLNRPQVLNALTWNMARLMNAKLIAWAEDPAIRAVAITGAGDRAFCSGGDIKAVAKEAKETGGKGPMCREFFRDEYILNHRIHAYPKPYIALVDGIVMGGGKGLSAHGSHRVVSEKVTFAMPETGIGFFPDVGGGYFLPRCPGETGTYLALTSARIGAADAVYVGFGTHFVESKNFPALTEALIREKDIDAALRPFTAAAPGEPALAQEQARIDACFGYNRVEDILTALSAENSPFALDALKAMRAVSPTSLKVALAQIRYGKHLSFKDVMKMEYRLSQHLLGAPDFYEGVRAALIDKDRSPKWTPATVEAVDDRVIEGYFSSLGANDLTFA